MHGDNCGIIVSQLQIIINYDICIIAEYPTQLPQVYTERQLQISEVHLQSLQIYIWKREREMNDTYCS